MFVDSVPRKRGHGLREDPAGLRQCSECPLSRLSSRAEKEDLESLEERHRIASPDRPVLLDRGVHAHVRIVVLRGRTENARILG